MTYNLQVLPRAEREINESILWFEQQSRGLGYRFFNDLSHLMDQISSHPYLFPLKRPPYREAIMNSFPYVIIFELQDNTIAIYSVFNTHRDPAQRP